MSGTGILTVLHVKPETIGLRAIPYLEANNHYTIGYNLLPSEALIARTTKTKWLGDSLLTSILKSTDYIHEHRLCDWSKLCPIHAQPSPPRRPPPPLPPTTHFFTTSPPCVPPNHCLHSTSQFKQPPPGSTKLLSSFYIII
jgi:hypothetical protein